MAPIAASAPDVIFLMEAVIRAHMGRYYWFFFLCPRVWKTFSRQYILQALQTTCSLLQLFSSARAAWKQPESMHKQQGMAVFQQSFIYKNKPAVSAHSNKLCPGLDFSLKKLIN